MIVSRKFNLYSCFVFLFYGGFFTAAQVLVNTISIYFNANEVEKGVMVGSIYLGTIIMVLILGEISNKIGKRQGVYMASILLSIGAMMIACSTNITIAIAGFFIFGCGIGGFESNFFSLIDDYNGKKSFKHLNYLQIMFSSGAVIFPLLFKSWNWLSFRMFYTFTAIFMLGNAIVFILDRSIDSFVIKEVNENQGLAIFKLLGDPVLISYMIMIFLYIASESGVLYWLVQFFDGIGAEELGVLGISLYWLLSIPGRAISSHIENVKVFLTVCFLMASIGFAILLFVPNAILKLVGLALLGLAFSPVYPGLLALAGGLFKRGKTMAYALMIFSAGLGGTAIQPLIGFAAQKYSISIIYFILMILSIILSVMFYITTDTAQKIPRKE